MRNKRIKRCGATAPGDVPDHWAQGICDLLVMLPHSDWTEDGWKTLQGDAVRFLRHWASQAHKLGWEALDLFGVQPHQADRNLVSPEAQPRYSGKPLGRRNPDHFFPHMVAPSSAVPAGSRPIASRIIGRRYRA